MTLPQTLQPPAGVDLLGTVEGIFVAPVAEAPMQPRTAVRAESGRGLEGDRYFDALGTYSNKPGPDREVTLIQAEALDDLAAATGVSLANGASRRNVVTRGVRLADLVGKRFWIGEVLLEGVRDCPPCGHLERLTQPGVARGLLNQGGLRAAIRHSGTIHTGDPICLA